MSTGHDEDFAQWAEAQARLLRERKFDKIDLDNLVEEVESIKSTEARDFDHHLKILLMYLLKWRFFEGLRNDNWRSTVSEHRHHLEFILRDSPSLKSHGEDALQSVYPSALLAVAKDTGISFDLLPEACPWRLETVMDDNWMPGDRVDDETIDHDEFRIGTEFYTESGLWRCTDVGTRTIVAVAIKDGYPAPHQIPPFADAVEEVFDEYDFGGLYREPVEP